MVIRPDAFLCSSNRPPTAYLGESAAMEGSSVLSSVPSSRCLCRSCELQCSPPRGIRFDIVLVVASVAANRRPRLLCNAMQLISPSSERIALALLQERVPAGQHTGFAWRESATSLTPHHTTSHYTTPFSAYQLGRAVRGGQVRARMPDAGCWTLDAGCWMLDAGCRMLDAGLLDRTRRRQ